MMFYRYQLALDAKKQRASKAAATTGPKFKQASNPKQVEYLHVQCTSILGMFCT